MTAYEVARKKIAQYDKMYGSLYITDLSDGSYALDERYYPGTEVEWNTLIYGFSRDQAYSLIREFPQKVDWHWNLKDKMIANEPRVVFYTERAVPLGPAPRPKPPKPEPIYDEQEERNNSMRLRLGDRELLMLQYIKMKQIDREMAIVNLLNRGVLELDRQLEFKLNPEYEGIV